MRTSISSRVKKHRAGLRARACVPYRFGVPDARRPGFAEECRRQSRLLCNDSHEQETLAWLSAAADTDGWK